MTTTPTLATGLYRRHARDAISLEDGGTLGRDRATEFWREQNDNIIVDTATGAMRFGDNNPQAWKIVQKGGPTDDFVAVPHLDPAIAATDFIRVRAWTELNGNRPSASDRHRKSYGLVAGQTDRGL